MKLHKVFRRPSLGGLLKRGTPDCPRTLNAQEIDDAPHRIKSDPFSGPTFSEPILKRTENQARRSPDGSGSNMTFYTESSIFNDASSHVPEQAQMDDTATSFLDEGNSLNAQPDQRKNSATVLTELLQSQHEISKALGELALGMAKLVDEKEFKNVAKPRFSRRLWKKKSSLGAGGDEQASVNSVPKDGSVFSFRRLKKSYSSLTAAGDEQASATSIATEDFSLAADGDKQASATSIATKDDGSVALLVGRDIFETSARLDSSKLEERNMNHIAHVIDSLVVRQEELAVQIVSIAADAMRKAEDKELEIQRLQHTLRHLESYVASKRTSAKRRLSMGSLSTFGSNKAWPKITEEIDEHSVSDCSADLPAGIPRVIDISHTIVDIEKICEHDGEEDTASYIPDHASIRLLM